MALFKYFKREDKTTLPTHKSCPSLSKPQLDGANESVVELLGEDSDNKQRKTPHVQYNNYTAAQRAMIGKYADENRPTKAARHYSSALNIKVIAY